MHIYLFTRTYSVNLAVRIVMSIHLEECLLSHPTPVIALFHLTSMFTTTGPRNMANKDITEMLAQSN